MRAIVTWTAAMDSRLAELRKAEVTYQAVADDMGLTRDMVIERCRRIGLIKRRNDIDAQGLAQQSATPKPHIQAPTDRGRVPLAAGHPLSWGLLTQGTLLDGAQYPRPVFL